MIKINTNFLDSILHNKSNKSKKCYEDPTLFTQLHFSISNLFTYFSTNCSKYEVAQIINSNHVYLKTKSNTSLKKINYKPGQLVMVDLGLNFNNLSYKHPCIVLANINDKVFIVPCSSTTAPINSKTHELEYGYLVGGKSDGFKHDTTIILKEASCIDKSQIIHPIKSRNSLKKITPEFLRLVNQNLFEMLFENYNYKLNKIESEYNDLLRKHHLLQDEVAMFKTNEDE